MLKRMRQCLSFLTTCCIRHGCIIEQTRFVPTFFWFVVSRCPLLFPDCSAQLIPLFAAMMAATRIGIGQGAPNAWSRPSYDHWLSPVLSRVAKAG